MEASKSTGLRRLLIATPLAVLLWLSFFWTPSPAQAAGPMLGVGLPYPTDVYAFDSIIGYRTDIFLIYQAVGQPFRGDELAPLAQNGRIIQLSWEPWDPFSSSGANQPSYQLRDITRGDFDADIRRWARELRDFGYTVRLRPMCEMNGNWTSWSGGVNGNVPSDYIPAWRHIHDIFVQEGATNVKWVWSPNRDGSAADAQNTFNTYYPGDAYVDYVGINGYNWGTMYNSPSWISTWQSFTEVFRHSYDVFSSRTSKPMQISETASTEIGGSKAAWITDAFYQLPSRFPRLDSVTWFNYNKETDWRINSSWASYYAFRDAAMSLDDGPPAVSIKSLANGATLSGARTVTVNASDDNAVSRVELFADETLMASSTQAPYTTTLNTRALPDGQYQLTAVAYDFAGKTDTAQITVNISNPGDRDYHFNWYDSASAGMSTWMVIANPGTATQHVEVYMAGGLLGSYDVAAGGRVTPIYPGRIGGPVKVVSTSGGKLLVSERSLINGNFTEVAAVPQSDLDSDQYLPWYDEYTPGARSWIMVSNQNDNPADVDITIGGQSMGRFHVPSGGVVTPEFPGVMKGPVQVTSTSGESLVVSGRTTYMGSLNETHSQRGAALSSEYYFPWYDAAGMRSWVIVNNLGDQGDNVTIRIGSQEMGTWWIPAGGTITPEFAGVMDGPVQVTSTSGRPLMASVRSLFNSSLKEVMGASPASLTSSQWFGWYDSASAGMAAWIMVGNTNQQQAQVRIKIHGQTMGTYTIPAGGRITPMFNGVINGPVEVTETGGRPLLVSQRVLYFSSFNELAGGSLR